MAKINKFRKGNIIFVLIILVLLLAPLGISYVIITGKAQKVLRAFELSDEDGEARIIDITASQFQFNPNVIRVGLGEKIIFRVTSTDVMHGFYIDGKDVFAEVPPGETIEVGPLQFNQPGKFKIRCAITCGPLHPFMIADLIVEPDYTLFVFVALTVLTAITVLLYVKTKGREDRILGINRKVKIDVLKRVRIIGPLLKRVLQWRGIHFLLILPNLLFFMLIFATGFFGNPTGNKNFSIAVVWILWFALIEFMIIFASRTWCTMCPLPAVGEWIARRRFVGVHKVRKWFSLNKKWPKSLDNMWIGALSFLVMSLMILWLVTRPVISAILFLILIIMGTVLYLIVPARHFCRSICPAGAYIGYHSNESIFEVRSRSKAICDAHPGKECIRGSPKGYGCPWKLYPGGNQENTYCGQCYECLKNCPLDNMTIKARMIGEDLPEKAIRTKNNYDESWMGFIRFSLVIFYTLAFFGPYWFLKDWGNMGNPYGANLASINLLMPTMGGFQKWLNWALLVSFVALIGFPAIFYGFSWLARKAAKVKDIPTKDMFGAYSYVLAPFGLTLWIGFAITLILVNWAYPVNAFSDPFGWGWNLFGFKFDWYPIFPNLIPFIQLPLILLGLALAINFTYIISLKFFNGRKPAFRSTAVMTVLYTGSALLFVYLIG